MPSSMAIALSTRGHVCQAADQIVVVSELVPSLSASPIEPQINTTDQKPPEFAVLSVDPSPDTETADVPGPSFSVCPVEVPIPTAATKGDSKTPEVRIRTVEDLKPTIVKGDD